MSLVNQLDKQRIFLKNNFSYVKTRVGLLFKFKGLLLANLDKVFDAYKKDFNKPADDVYISEIVPIIDELNFFIKKTKWLSRKKFKWSGFRNSINSNSYIATIPYGSVLLILSHDLILSSTLIPLIGAIAAGNTLFIKLPEYSHHLNKIIKAIVSNIFDENYVYFVEENQTEDSMKKLYELDFDLVFFIGKKNSAKTIIKNFSTKFIDVAYQLSSKCPVIIDETANVNLAAKKIIWAKMLNAGQTPYSPNYLVVHESIYDYLLAALKQEYYKQFGQYDYKTNLTKIYKDESYKVLVKLIEKHRDRIRFGGEYDDSSRSIQLTLINIDDLKSDLITTEIHGPILPIIKYNNESDIYGIVDLNHSSLAAYVFSKNKTFKNNVKNNISSKTIVFNDSMIQIFYNIPFGGIRTSGNRTFGKNDSWRLFTYKKLIIKASKLSWLSRFKPHADSLKKIKTKYKL